MTEHYPQMSHAQWLEHQEEIRRKGQVIVGRQKRLNRIAELRQTHFSKAPQKKLTPLEETKQSMHNLAALANIAKRSVSGVA